MWNDMFGTPKSMSLPWAALVLATVGLNKSTRLRVLAVAAALDAVVLGGRYLFDVPLTVGNGPSLVLVALAFHVVRRHDARAMRGVALGALLLLATKAGDAWLHITMISRPRVLDEYAHAADHALGDPSWVMGAVLERLGPVADGVLHWVYIQLPVAAIVVALYQLRGVAFGAAWPRHFLFRTFLLIGLVGPVFYLLFPVVGPVFAFDGWPHASAVTGSLGEFSFDAGIPRNCMPSLHTAWALSIFIHSRRGPWWLRTGGTLWLLGTLAATLGFGYHYGVDLVAGAVLCLTIESLLRDPERGWDRDRITLVTYGCVAMAALLLSYRYLAEEFAANPLVFGPLVLGILIGMAFGFHTAFFADRSRFTDRVRSVPSR
ncbi:inositol phosphorylceramide synthase [Rhodococcus fascians]|nr:inositol phosphorylceramide synthase [Rhodococcus fascians]MBY3995499.1 inositol phosphorylceramide synthase [Rhodococcus fascians]MBY4001995.1 inositol phosphorylceramide synthase [Rhodococcus fascians]MBY4007172.1 inositol phosphorylceramide synthase [Rhodococcus fascians]MBY4016108.1 inositol phosphorylceramide synthase [Rhodococcus fascians]